MLALAAVVLAVAPSVALADPTPAEAIAELNSWRAQLGESPVSSTPVVEWDTGCQDHNAYEHLNGILTHPENPGSPGYTPDGATAGPDSVLAEETSSPDAFADNALLPGPVWDSAVFHRAALLEPRLANVGFNSSTFLSARTYTSWVCMWVENDPAEGSPYVPPTAIDNGLTTPWLALYPSPANGTVDVPTTFPAGTESPDPGQETGVPAGATLGWLLNVEINGPWGQSGGGGIVWAHGVQATLENDATKSTVPVVVSECGSTPCDVSGTGNTCDTSTGGTSYGCYFGGGFGIFPLQALAPDTTYRVVLTAGTVTDESAPNTPYAIPANYSWCFSTGRTYTASADCAASGAGVEPGGMETNPTAPLGPGGSGSSGQGPLAAPTISRRSLTLSRVRSKLAFSISSGKPLRTVAVTLPSGLSFSSKAASLGHGIAIAQLTFTARATLATLTIRLKRSADRIALSISNPELQLGGALLRRVKHHRVGRLTFVVRATDTSGAATTLRLTFTLH